MYRAGWICYRLAGAAQHRQPGLRQPFSPRRRPASGIDRGPSESERFVAAQQRFDHQVKCGLRRNAIASPIRHQAPYWTGCSRGGETVRHPAQLALMVVGGRPPRASPKGGRRTGVWQHEIAGVGSKGARRRRSAKFCRSDTETDRVFRVALILGSAATVVDP